MIKAFIFLGIGLFGGLWIAWPGITNKSNWSCVQEVITSSRRQKANIRSLMAVSPRHILQKESKTSLGNLRLVSDTCFR